MEFCRFPLGMVKFQLGSKTHSVLLRVYKQNNIYCEFGHTVGLQYIAVNYLLRPYTVLIPINKSKQRSIRSLQVH